MEVEWYCTIAMSARCSMHQLPKYLCTLKLLYAPLASVFVAYVGIYGHSQPYIHAVAYIYIHVLIVCMEAKGCIL